MRNAVTALLTSLALGAVLAGPALAAKPVIESFEFSDAFYINCGTFSLYEEVTVSGRETVWVDANGNPTRAQVHVTFQGTITGSGGIGSLSDTSHFTEFVDFDPDGATVRQVGLIYSFRVPGRGLVAHDVGIITFFPDGSVETNGPHDVWYDGLESLICPLFE